MGINVRAIIKKNNKYLLVQRVFSDSGGGLWQMPGGKTDGENLISALKREILEEVGLIIIKAKFYKKLKNRLTGHTAYYFLVKTNGNINLQKSELQNYGWFTKQEARKLSLSENAYKVLK